MKLAEIIYKLDEIHKELSTTKEKLQVLIDSIDPIEENIQSERDRIVILLNDLKARINELVDLERMILLKIH